MRKMLLIIFVVVGAFASYTEHGHPYEYAVIKHIRIGDNFEEACMQIKYLVKENEPDTKVHVSKNSCTFGIMGTLGISADDEGVSEINIPVYYLGYTIDSTPSAVKKIAQDYLLSENNMVSRLEPATTFNKYDRKYYLSYYGYNAQGTVKIEINYWFISMRKVNRSGF